MQDSIEFQSFLQELAKKKISMRRKLMLRFIDLDTRALEFFAGLYSLMWAIWLFIATKDQSLTIQILRAWSIFNGVSQITGVWVLYPHLRRYAATSSSIYWTVVLVYLLNLIPFNILCWLSALCILAQLTIVFKRSVVGK